jgi:uncharacterized membrane protein YqaE (UPF0057 family)
MNLVLPHAGKRNLVSVYIRDRNSPDRRTYQTEKSDKERFGMDLFRIILAIILPPVGVFLQVGFGLQFWLNIVLTLLGYIPGIIHAVWVIAKY